MRYGSITASRPPLPGVRPAPRAPRPPRGRRPSSARAARPPAPASGRPDRGRREVARAPPQPPAIWSGLSSDPLLACDPAEHAVHQRSGLGRCVALPQPHRLVDRHGNRDLAAADLPYGQAQDVALEHGHAFRAPSLGRRVDAPVDAVAVGPRALRLGANELGHGLAIVALVRVVERPEVAAGEVLLVEE